MSNFSQLLVVAFSATQSAMDCSKVICTYAQEIVAKSQVLVAFSQENRQVARATMECAQGLRQVAITRRASLTPV